jgi:nitrogenase molybdenum-iron protein beta chain
MSEILQAPRYFCALGAQQTVTAIERAIPIVHAGPGCSAKLFQAMGGSAGNQGAGYAGGDSIPCSNMIEKDVVFGGVDKLRSLIEGTLKIMDGDFFVVLTGCTSDLVGDDVGSVVQEFCAQGVPIVYAETGGFKGDAFTGYELVLKAIIEQYLKPAKSTRKGVCNVFASVPGADPFWEGDLHEIAQLLKCIGLQPNFMFGYGSGGIRAIDAIPEAEFNLVISPYNGLPAARLLNEKFGTPYLHIPCVPVGAAGSGSFLRQVAAFAGLDMTAAEQTIKRLEDEYYHYLTKSADFLIESRYSLPKRFFTIGDANFSLAFSRFLVQDMGYLPALQFVTEKVPEEFQQDVEAAFQELAPVIRSKVIFCQDGGAIEEAIADYSLNSTPLVLGSSWDVDIAQAVHGVHLSVGLPITDRLILHHTYTGYRGGLNLVQDVYSKLLSLQG